MFVLSTRYAKAIAEKQHLTQSVSELSAEIKQLQASNDQLFADAKTKALADLSPEKYERVLVTGFISSRLIIRINSNRTATTSFI